MNQRNSEIQLIITHQYIVLLISQFHKICNYWIVNLSLIHIQMCIRDRLHTASATQAKLEEPHRTAFDHPLYSLLQIYHHMIFICLENLKKLRSTKFSSDKEVQNLLRNWLRIRPTNFIKKVLKHCQCDYNKCIDIGEADVYKRQVLMPCHIAHLVVKILFSQVRYEKLRLDSIKI